MTSFNKRVPVIGFVGGIGSGKSFLAESLRKKHKIEILNGDIAGHQVLQQELIKDQIRRQFGETVFNEQGEIDRRKLGRLVFGSDEAHSQARVALESIVHPQIKKLLLSQIERAQSQPELEAIVLDAAILLEAGWHMLCDAVVFINVPLEQRIERVIQNRGWSRDELNAREASQLPLDVKRSRSDYEVDNSQGPEPAIMQLEQILSHITTRAATRVDRIC